MAQDDERINGRYKGAIELVSGKYAMIETPDREFTQVLGGPSSSMS